jgi:hypothetical protein
VERLLQQCIRLNVHRSLHLPVSQSNSSSRAPDMPAMRTCMCIVMTISFGPEYDDMRLGGAKGTYCGFIQHKNGRRREQRAGQRQELLLPLAKIRPCTVGQHRERASALEASSLPPSYTLASSPPVMLAT